MTSVRKGLIVVMVPVCVLLLEGGYFSCVLTRYHTAERSDAIVIFSGSEKRIAAGYGLANQGLANALILSPATDAVRFRYDGRYALKDGIVHIPEEQATTTFENALYTARIIRDHRCRSLILVTSDYHMPRSLALLRLFLAGEDVRIQCFPVRGGAAAAPPILLKLVYNEMLEFWGSLSEFVMYWIRGGPAVKPAKKSAFSLFLRTALLLDVKPAW